MEFFKFLVILFICIIFLGSFYYGGLLFKYRFTLEDAVNHAARIAVTRGIRGGLWLDPSGSSAGDFFLQLGALIDQNSGLNTNTNLTELPEGLMYNVNGEVGLIVARYNELLRRGNNPLGDNSQGNYLLPRIHIGHLLAISLANLYVRNALGRGLISYPCLREEEGEQQAEGSAEVRSCLDCFVTGPFNQACVTTQDVSEITPESFKLICELHPGDFIFRLVSRLANALSRDPENNFTITAEALVSYPTGLTNPWTRVQENE